MIVALDIGTSSCKAVAVTGGCEVVRRSASGYSLRASDGRAELDADEVVTAVESSLAGLGDAVAAARGIVLSSAMHSVVAVDERGHALMPVLTWADARGAEQAAGLRRSGAAEGLWTRTGTPIHASSPLCKLMWLREHDASLFAEARAFVSIKELVLRRWLGTDAVDASIASATGLYDLERRDWDAEALGLCGVGPDRLGRIVSTTATVDSWQAGVAARLGIRPDLPVVVGASDGVLANVGVGAVDPGVIAVTLGTSAAARTVVRQPRGDPDRGLFCYVLDEDRFVTGGAINNAGLVVQWLAEKLFGGREIDVLSAAERSPAGARGLTCTPRLTGERFPDYDSDRRGTFEGVSLEHDRTDFARAALEGVLRSVVAVVEAVSDACGGAVSIRGGGGLLESELVRELLAELLGRPVEVPATVEATAVGAARLAAAVLD